MKNSKYIGLLVGLLFAATSCDTNEADVFNAADTNVSFPKSSFSIAENSKEPLKIPVVLAGVPGGVKVTVEFTVTSEGEGKPAMEGTDFKLLNKSLTFNDGFGSDTLLVEPIDNNVFSGNKAFSIMISSTSPKLTESVQNTVRVTLTDDDHPLSYMFGIYNMTGLLVSNGQAVENGYPVEILAGDGPDEIMVDFGYPELVKASVEEVDGETVVTFANDQNVGEAQAGYIAHFVWTEYRDGEMYFNLDNKVLGIYNDGVIKLNEDNGLGFLAFQNDEPYAWFEFWVQGSVTFTRE